jgi:hypothetical protein
MQREKQQLEKEGIGMENSASADVVAYGEAYTPEQAGECTGGYHWDPSSGQCVRDSPQI